MLSKQLLILASHPVQYQVPFFRELVADGWNIKVGNYHRGAAGQVVHDTEFGMDMEWDIDLLSGYPHRVFVEGKASFRRFEQIKVAPKLLFWALKDRETPLLLVGWFAEVIWLVWLIRILLNAPVMVMGDNTPQSFAATPKPFWRLVLLRWLLRQTTAVFYVGQNNRNFWIDQDISSDRLFYAPHCIDNDRFANSAKKYLPQRHDLCLQYGLDPEKPTFLFCGKLVPIKRPMELLEAYYLAGLNDKAQLIYVGDGILRHQLEQRVQELKLNHVHFLGFLNQSQMPLAYVLGEVLCLVSKNETWGLVVNEAMACGRPVVVSDAVGCAIDLVGPDNGWVFPVNDLSALTEILHNVYESRHSWSGMGTAGQEKVSRHTYAYMVKGVRAALKTI